jgi:hypothetical protein
MAVENAPPHERIWVEEGYAAIFCAASQITRVEAGVLVARWRQTFLRPDGAAARTGSFELLPARQCASGEQVAVSAPGASKAGVPADVTPAPTGTAPATVGTLKAVPAAPAGFKAAGIAGGAAKK